MRRARVAPIVLVVSVVASAAGVRAQSAAVPEGWVVLPVDEYRALRERAIPPQPVPLPPPIDATLTRIDYDLHVEAEAVAGRAMLTIDVLRDGWSKLPIPAGLMVRDAALDGRRVSLVDGTPPHLLLSRAGRSVLALEVVIPVTSAGGTDSIVLPPSPSPISRARMTLPKNGVELSAGGGFIADRAETANESRWTAYGRPNQPLALTWKRRVDDRRAEQPLRVRARVTELVAIGEDSSQVAAAVRVEVLQGLARDVTLTIPPGLVVNQVDGSTVADWDVNNGTLHVALLEPTASEVSLVVQADARTPREGSVAIPLIRMPAAERETGGIAVDVAGAGEVASRQVRGLEPADPSELGDVVADRDSPSMIGFRHRPIAGAEPRSLTVDVVRYTPQAVVIANVEEARYRALVSEDGRLLVEARYAVRNNQRSFLKASLPDGASLWSAEVAGRPIRPGFAEHGAVLLPLVKGRPGDQAPTFVVELVYLQRVDAWADKSRPRLELPALDLPVSRTGLELHHSPRFRIEPLGGPFRVDADAGPAAEALRQPVTGLNIEMRRVEDRSTSGLQALVDRFRNESAGKTVTGALPVHIEFPSFGPSVFLAAELTAEGRAPAVELLVRRVS
jgi:hypothetical protein